MAVGVSRTGTQHTPGVRISNLVPHYRPLSHAGPSLAQHPRLIAECDRESYPFTRFINPFRSWGMREALMKNTLWGNSPLLSVNLSSGSFWFHLPPSQNKLARARPNLSSFSIV
jgi:hypothetical protein